MGRRAGLLVNALKRRAFWNQEGRCFYCSEPMMWRRDPALKRRPNRRVTAEHLEPSSRGGPDTFHNVVAACYGCNHERGDMPLLQWVSVLQGRLRAPQFALLLQRLAKLGIKPPIGHPAQAAPTVDDTPIVRAPEVDTPAPA